ncbi:hypothetical protein AB4Z40_35355 [Bosea sp. 2YAB26]|jgi:hypothetical protein|uniref:hypothetical protein n=1 Tax=Bosea sp. 2YAB26 TaxID=3237478 RepID=UPI003F8F9BE7
MAYRPHDVMFAFAKTRNGTHVALAMQKHPYRKTPNEFEIEGVDLDTELCLQNGFLPVGPRVWSLVGDIDQEMAVAFLTGLGFVYDPHIAARDRATDVVEGRSTKAILGFYRAEWLVMVVTSVALASWVAI